MLAAGILAALVILFSQAFEKEASSLLSRIKSTKTEKQEKARDTNNKVVVSASSDAVTSGQAVNTGDTDHTLIREIVFDQEKNAETPAMDHAILANFFKTLFRVFISPQAP